MRSLVLVIGLSIWSFQVFGQIVSNPEIRKSDIPYCKIKSIDISQEKTNIVFYYIAPETYINGGSVCVGDNFFLRDNETGNRYYLIKANNIPICPQKHRFRRQGESLTFSLEFQPIPKMCKEIDIIEKLTGKGFNFYGISLQKISHSTRKLNFDGKMRESANVLSDIISIVPAGIKVKVITSIEGFYKVEYNGKLGYINSIYFESTGISGNYPPKNNNSNNITDNVNCNEIKYIKGRSYSSKPSLSHRLSGCNKIYVPVPNNSSFEWQGFVRYLRDLGLTVVTTQKKFEKKAVDLGTVVGVFTIYQGTDFVNGDNVNNLGAILNTLNAASTYSDNVNTAKIAFVDLNNSYSWTYELDIPNSYEKYKEKLKRIICSSVSKDPSASVLLPKKISCWNEQKIKQNFTRNGMDNFEGIYENISSIENEAKYKVAVKKISGKYHLIYLSGAINTQEWSEGEVKAILEKTSKPGFFKAKWYMANKSENDDFYISFENDFMNVNDQKKDKNVYVKLFPTANDNVDQYSNTPSSGTGFALTSNGLIITNNHVIKGAKTIKVKGINGDFSRTYSAQVVTSDRNNDLAIIKIDDYRFKNLGRIPYSIKYSNSSVGESIYVLGYPLRDTMGEEIKMTDGIVSSKSGFQGDITAYQISAPVQPGNSGGPLFDKQGNIIGIINAKHIGAENASYAIKVNYLINLINSLEYPPEIPSNNLLIHKPLTQQILMVKNFIYIIEALPE